MALKGQGTFAREDPTLTALAGVTTAADMSTIFYTKNGIIQYILSDGMSIPADEKNRDYRKVMAQDAITPFERVEIVEPEPSNTPTNEERLASVEMALLELAEALL